MSLFSRNRDFRLLLVGQTLSGLGTWINFVGLNLLVLHLFGSGTILGSFLVARTLPALLFGPVGGALADRFPRRTLLALCDASRALLVLVFLVTRDLTTFFVVGTVVSCVDKVFQAALGPYTADVTGDEDLQEATAASRMAASAVTVAGPALGGMIVQAWGFGAVFVVDAATFVVSVACLLLARTRGEPAPHEGGTAPGLRQVWTLVRGGGSLGYLLGLRVVDALGSGAYNTALPLLATALAAGAGGRGLYGWVVGAWALGQLVGAAMAARMPRTMAPAARDRIYALATLAMAAGMGATFHARSVVAAAITVFLGGVADGLSSVIFSTALVRDTPPALRGRVVGTSVAAMYGAVAVGMAAAGVGADRWSLQGTTDAASAFIVFGVVVGYGWHVVRRRGAAAPGASTGA